MAYWSTNTTLQCKLTGSECMARLRAASMQDVILAEFRRTASKPVFGHFKNNSFALRTSPAWPGQSWSSKALTVMRGRIKENANGTTLHIHWGLPRLGEAFGAIWLTGTVILGVGLVAQNGVEAMVNAVALPLWGIGLVTMNWYLEKKERAFLLEYLKETLEIPNST